MTFDVEATTSGSPGQLCELPGRQNLVGLAGELGETVDDPERAGKFTPRASVSVA